jgi:hypothetical protein
MSARQFLSGPRLWLGIGALALIVLAAGAIGFAIGNSTKDSIGSSAQAASASKATKHVEPRLQKAYDSCLSSDSGKTLELGDAGETIVVDTGSKYGSLDGMVCVLTYLDTPQSITAQMDSTTAMMGVQEADHDGLNYSWSYHPDNGVNMVITDSRASK